VLEGERREVGGSAEMWYHQVEAICIGSIRSPNVRSIDELACFTVFPRSRVVLCAYGNASAATADFVWWTFAVYEFGRVTVRGGCNICCPLGSHIAPVSCLAGSGVSGSFCVCVLVRVLLPYFVLMEVLYPCSEQCEEAIVLMRLSVTSAVSLGST